MPSNIWKILDEVRSSIVAEPYIPEVKPESGFPIHPSASELAESMLQDPDALKNETYEPGIYDEEGDYYPQYADDPSKMPEYIAPNPLDGGDTAPESSPAEELASSSEPSNDNDNSSVS